jgi:hypothetical protein
VNKKFRKKTIAAFILLLLVLVFLPFASSITIEKIEGLSDELTGIEEEITLLQSEHYFYFKAVENVPEFNIKYAFPPVYAHQAPIMIEILDDSAAHLINYKIENDIYGSNKVVNFTIGSMAKNATKMIHFYQWALVRNLSFSDFPEYVEIPSEQDLPVETITWLNATKVVQKDNFLIRLRAKMLKGFSTNLVKLADRIAKFSKYHRYGMFLIQYYLQSYRGQDALTTLFLNGECPGRSHLCCALFRANNVPARVILANPTNGIWFEMHYMAEYYLPEYEWVLTEVHGAETPAKTNRQIILRICYPEDEENAQPDNLFPKMTGLEKWFWIKNENVEQIYTLSDFDNSSRIRTYNRKNISTDEAYVNLSLDLTKDTFQLYKQYLGMSLTEENLRYFQNATAFQKEAINKFIELDEPFGYLYFMDQAFDELNKITV